ncbi:MAG: thioesterase family protein [Chitinophagales bacterium]
MKKVLTYKGAVMTWECDSNGHMNVMYYINKFEHGGRNFTMEMGMFELEDGKNIGVVVLEQQIKYLQEVFEDDLLYIESTLLDVGNKAFTILHEMYRNPQKELVSTMKLVLVLFDKETRKSLPFPKDKRELLLKELE